MEGLCKQALLSFGQLKFFPTPHEHELITISSPGAPPTRVCQPLSQMLESFQRSSSHTPPALRLVKLRILHPTFDTLTGPYSINASQEDMMDLWALFDLDPTALQLLTKGIQGFSQHRPLAWDAAAQAFYFMASSFTYSIVWTYRVSTQSTSGVMVMRHKDISGRHFELWWDALCAQATIARHPLCPFLALTMQTMQVASRGTLECQGQVASVEIMTGFGPFHGAGTDPGGQPTLLIQLPLDKVTLASRNVGAMLVLLEDDARQLRCLQRITDSLAQAGYVNIPGSVGEAAEVATAVGILRQQMDSGEILINYLRERAKNQLTVLFNLTTRYDAKANIAVARAAKKDSASMKAIALMTMAFLPGTFVATLFSVPSLRWDLETVIQMKFWVYWVFAIPATIFVFGFWFWLSKERESPENTWDSEGTSSSRKEEVP